MKTPSHLATVLVALGFAACAKGEAVSDESVQVLGTGGVEAGGPAGGTGGGGGQSGSPSCAPGEKVCGGRCVQIAPAVGCGAADCAPCSPPLNAMSACNGNDCSFACIPGFMLVANVSCQPEPGSGGKSSSGGKDGVGGSGDGGSAANGGKVGTGGRGSSGSGSTSGGASSGGSTGTMSGGAPSGGAASGGAQTGGSGSGGTAAAGASGSGGASQCVASRCSNCLLLTPACCWMGGTSCGCQDALGNCLAPLGPGM